MTDEAEPGLITESFRALLSERGDTVGDGDMYRLDLYLTFIRIMETCSLHLPRVFDAIRADERRHVCAKRADGRVKAALSSMRYQRPSGGGRN